MLKAIRAQFQLRNPKSVARVRSNATRSDSLEAPKGAYCVQVVNSSSQRPYSALGSVSTLPWDATFDLRAIRAQFQLRNLQTVARVRSNATRSGSLEAPKSAYCVQVVNSSSQRSYSALGSTLPWDATLDCHVK